VCLPQVILPDKPPSRCLLSVSDVKKSGPARAITLASKIVDLYLFQTGRPISMRLMKRGDFGVEYAELTFKDQVLLYILAVELVD